ncbi:MAG: hypothetical protein ACJA2O_001218, partial [Candidatus Azotimanducaceae bacterium]
MGEQATFVEETGGSNHALRFDCLWGKCSPSMKLYFALAPPSAEYTP